MHKAMDMMKIATESMTKKQPRTFSLSRDVIDILERYKKERKAGSLTAAVEEIVREWTTVQMENIKSVLTTSLQEPRTKLRRLSERTIERTARCVVMAMGFAP